MQGKDISESPGCLDKALADLDDRAERPALDQLRAALIEHRGVAAGLPSKVETLYTLDTFCSLQGKDAEPCIVTAVDVGDTTEYRHRIGGKEVIFRIIDDPITRLELWDPAGKSWQSAR